MKLNSVDHKINEFKYLHILEILKIVIKKRNIFIHLINSIKKWIDNETY